MAIVSIRRDESCACWRPLPAGCARAWAEGTIAMRVHRFEAHTEASFSPSSIDSLRLRVAQMPRSPDLMIFVRTSTVELYPCCACARGVMRTLNCVGGALKPHPSSSVSEKRMAVRLEHCMSWFFRLFVILKVAQVQGLDNGLALTPPSTLSWTFVAVSESIFTLCYVTLVIFSTQWAGCSGRDLHATLTVNMILTIASGRTKFRILVAQGLLWLPSYIVVSCDKDAGHKTT